MFASIKKVILRSVFLYHVGFVVAFCFTKICVLPILPLAGYKKAVFGRSRILAPKAKLEQIVKGVLSLKSIDPEIYRRLTQDHSYMFWYHPVSEINCYAYFSINDDMLSWGEDGVVVCLVKAVLRLPGNNAAVRHESPDLVRRQVRVEFLEWIKTHSINPDLVKFYQDNMSVS